MRKRLLSTALVLVMAVWLGGCGTTYREAKPKAKSYGGGYFTEIVSWRDSEKFYTIVYANDTKVKYLFMYGNYSSGITPLYNADGTLQVYEGGE